jgi:hypothetical protein
MSVNISDPSKVKEAETKNKNKRDSELDAVRALLAHRSGRMFLWRYISQCNVFGNLVGADNEHTHRLIGQRNVGNMLIADITEADRTAFGKLMEEFGNE